MAKSKTASAKKESPLMIAAQHTGVAIVGAAAGSTLGRYALVATIATIGASAYFKQPLGFTAGAAMLAGVSLAGAAEKPATDGTFTAEAKENAMSFGRGLGLGVFIDKFAPDAAAKIGIGAQKTAAATAAPAGERLMGLGNMSVYMPRDKEEALANINRMIEESAIATMNGNPRETSQELVTMAGLPDTKTAALFN